MSELRPWQYPGGRWAHGIWQSVAVTLAEPLRKAYDGHIDAHGCGCLNRMNSCGNVAHLNNGGHRIPGTAYCDEAERLRRLLPDGDVVAIAGNGVWIPYA